MDDKEFITTLVGDEDWIWVTNFYLPVSSKLRDFIGLLKNKTALDLCIVFNEQLDYFEEWINKADSTLKESAIYYYSVLVPCSGVINGAINNGAIANYVLALVKKEAKEHNKPESEVLLDLAKLEKSDVYQKYVQDIVPIMFNERKLPYSKEVVDAYGSLIALQNRLHIFDKKLKVPFRNSLVLTRDEVLECLKL